MTERDSRNRPQPRPGDGGRGEPAASDRRVSRDDLKRSRLLDVQRFDQPIPPADSAVSPEHDELAAVAQAAQPRRRSPVGRRRSSRKPLVLTLIVAVLAVTFGGFAWREAAWIETGGNTLRDWIDAGRLPLPQGIAASTAQVRPYRSLRLGNLFGEARYAYELWATTAAGEQLAGKYLLAVDGAGELVLVAAYDVQRQRAISIPPDLDVRR